MINLLSDEEKSQIRAARLNVRLRRYLVATIIAMAAVGTSYGTGLLIAGDTEVKASAQNNSAEQQLVKYAEVKTTADSYRANLAIAKKILGGEIVFSTFLTDVAKVLPPGTILTSFNVSTKTAASTQRKAGQTQLKARAKSYQGVVALKTSLEASSLFSEVRIVTTTTPDSLDNKVGVERAYPFEVTFDLIIDPLAGVKK